MENRGVKVRGYRYPGCYFYRSTDRARSEEVARIHGTAIDGMMRQLLFHRPVHILFSEGGGKEGEG